MRLALRRRKSGSLPFEADATRAAWQVASLLLGYPDDALLGQLPLLRGVCERLPLALGGPLLALIDDLSGCPPEVVRTDFVQTFDYTRRCAPYLTYFAYGDTRRRGVALVTFKAAYRRAGVEFEAPELPDHLAVVLEFGALHDLTVAVGLMLEHRAGLEVLRLALLERGSRWASVLVAVCTTLPPLDGDEAAAVARLIEEGPPEEAVGLPYAMDPRLNPQPALDLPWTSALTKPLTQSLTEEGVRS